MKIIICFQSFVNDMEKFKCNHYSYNLEQEMSLKDIMKLIDIISYQIYE